MLPSIVDDHEVKEPEPYQGLLKLQATQPFTVDSNENEASGQEE